jgi:isopenicillin N synthase-like dioxygenase
VFPQLNVTFDSEMAPIIPTIDISPYLADANTEAAAAVVQAVRQAAMNSGFFQITGHQIPYRIQAEAFEGAKKLFELPLEEKRKLDRQTVPGACMRGYELLKSQEQEQGKGGDIKEVSTPTNHVLSLIKS